MALDATRRAIERIRADESGACWFVGERSESLIETAERTLGFRFPPSFRQFVRELGAGSIGSEEIYGVTSPNFDNGSIPNGVWLTLRARREWNLPDSLLVIYFDGGVGYTSSNAAQVTNQGSPGGARESPRRPHPVS